MSVQPAAAQTDLVFCKAEFQELQKRSILKVVFSEDLPLVKFLTDTAFDSSLWNELIRVGATRHHKLLIDENLTPGIIWAEKGMTGPILNWSDDQTIHRALIEGDDITLLSYSIIEGKSSVIKTALTPFKLGELIHSYLLRTETYFPIPSTWKAFKKTLELIPITCRVSCAAGREFLKLENNYPGKAFAFSLVFRGKSELLIEVSKNFFQSRIVTLDLNSNHSRVKSAVAPTLCSFKALKQLNDPTTDSLKIADLERAVHPHDPIPVKDITLSLHIRTGTTIKTVPFESKLVEKPKREHQFHVWIDFKDGKWKLESETII